MTIIYYILFFRNKFGYYICKKGLIVKGINLPKLYTWNSISKYKINNKILQICFKKTNYCITLPYKKGIEKYLKKHIKKNTNKKAIKKKKSRKTNRKLKKRKPNTTKHKKNIKKHKKT